MCMNGEAKKLHLIEEILKIENDVVLEEVETVISKNKLHVAGSKNFKEFDGIWTATEADEMTKVIEDICEQINPEIRKTYTKYKGAMTKQNLPDIDNQLNELRNF
jgi:hypothetical protein